MQNVNKAHREAKLRLFVSNHKNDAEIHSNC